MDPKRIAEAALRRLATFDFPGNVRQLENVCHWLTVMAPAQVIEVKDLPPEVLSMAAAGAHTVPGDGPAQGLAGLGEEGTSAQALAGNDGTGHLPSVAAQPTGEQAPPLAQITGTGTQVMPATGLTDWERGLQAEAKALLASERQDVWDVLTRRFETQLILAALAATRGRRIEAAHKLGIGRNTITRKIQELNLE